jgi:NAD(P)-dependent dehydrogenase (short-subunit alcohol dehydrogenase family)
MEDASELAGGVAVITGSARGIGKGIAKAAVARGMKLVLADIAADALHATAREFEAAGVEVLAVPTDVSDPSALGWRMQLTSALVRCACW